jgi:phenylpropionate dioxygenase-like ring-hydroxylating dioxygenase large terminal subunit
LVQTLEMLEQYPIRTGPILSDGTAFGDLIDLERREISMRVYNDPEIHTLEQELLFTTCWQIVGHDSEIPGTGDYVKRYLGEDAVIVARREDGDISVLLNVCTHRGMQVCLTDAGRASRFRCPYHGWTFAPDGRLIGAPFEREMFGAEFDKESLGLRRARVEICAGLIFATWDPAVPPLLDYLGGLDFYLEMAFGRTRSGVEVVGSPQRVLVATNWKTAAEQFNVDRYHFVGLHSSLFATFGADAANPADFSMRGIDVSVGGTGFIFRQSNDTGRRARVTSLPTAAVATDEELASLTPLEVITKYPPAGLAPELVPQLAETLSDAQLRMLARIGNLGAGGGCFPNGALFFAQPGMHLFLPRGPQATEYWYWALVDKDAPPAIKGVARRAGPAGVGSSSGAAAVDDAEGWAQVGASVRGAMGRRQTLKYHALSGQQRPAWFEGPGLVYDGFSRDDAEWNWWIRYFHVMTTTSSLPG